MSTNAVHQDILRQYLAEILDLGDIRLSALAGVIASKLDEAPQLTPRKKGGPVMRAMFNGVPYQFSRRGEAIVVHSGSVLMNTGELSENSSLSDIHRIFTTWVPRLPS